MNKLIVANWKQNKNFDEVNSWLNSFEKKIEELTLNNVDVVICPSYPYLDAVNSFAKKYDWIHVGSQDISRYGSGSYTGRVGVSQVSDFVKFSIVGHSELSETSEVVLEKTKRCIDNSIVPIVCFKDKSVLKLFEGIDVYFLWEDPATISKGGEFHPKSTEDIEKGILDIVDNYHTGKGILYGGSINRDNSDGLGRIENLSGGVSGSASLDPIHFYEIVKSFESINALR